MALTTSRGDKGHRRGRLGDQCRESGRPIEWCEDDWASDVGIGQGEDGRPIEDGNIRQIVRRREDGRTDGGRVG